MTRKDWALPVALFAVALAFFALSAWLRQDGQA